MVGVAGFEAVAQGVLTTIARRFRGRTCGRGPLRRARVHSVLHYGAVEIDPRHLTVWVLLEHVDPDRVPAWWSDGVSPTEGLDPDLAAWMHRLASEVRDALGDVGWPMPRDVAVLFDVNARVESGGGWNYFR